MPKERDSEIIPTKSTTTNQTKDGMKGTFLGLRLYLQQYPPKEKSSLKLKYVFCGVVFFFFVYLFFVFTVRWKKKTQTKRRTIGNDFLSNHCILTRQDFNFIFPRLFGWVATKSIQFSDSLSSHSHREILKANEQNIKTKGWNIMTNMENRCCPVWVGNKVATTLILKYSKMRGRLAHHYKENLWMNKELILAPLVQQASCFSKEYHSTGIQQTSEQGHLATFALAMFLLSIGKARWATTQHQMPLFRAS